MPNSPFICTDFFLCPSKLLNVSSLHPVLPPLADKPPNHDLSIEHITYIFKRVVYCYQLPTARTHIGVDNFPAAPNSINKEPNPLDTYRHLIRCLRFPKKLDNVFYYTDLPGELISSCQ